MTSYGTRIGTRKMSKIFFFRRTRRFTFIFWNFAARQNVENFCRSLIVDISHHFSMLFHSSIFCKYYLQLIGRFANTTHTSSKGKEHDTSIYFISYLHSCYTKWYYFMLNSLLNPFGMRQSARHPSTSRYTSFCRLLNPYLADLIK